jgi:hypothetical protein
MAGSDNYVVATVTNHLDIFMREGKDMHVAEMRGSFLGTPVGSTLCGMPVREVLHGFSPDEATCKTCVRAWRARRPVST